MNREFLEKLGLGKDIVDQIMKEHGKSIQSFSDYESVQTAKEALEQQVSDLQKTLASNDEKYKDYDSKQSELLQKVKGFETKELKLRIAHENKIPFELADRLSGETEDEIANDAKNLSVFVAKKDNPPLKTETNNTENPYADLVSKLK